MTSGEKGTPIALVEELPVPPGSSPFHVKGHVYMKMRSFIDDNVDGGCALLASRLEPATAAFFLQPFLAGSWYDALPLAPLSRAHARLIGAALHQHSRDRGRDVAKNDVPGVYRAVLKLVSPDLVAPRLPRAVSLYFDFGRPSVEALDERAARTTFGGAPSSLAPYLAGVFEGFMGGVLELAGAKNVSVRTLDVLYDGDHVGGIPTAAVRHELRWSK